MAESWQRTIVAAGVRAGSRESPQDGSMVLFSGRSGSSAGQTRGPAFGPAGAALRLHQWVVAGITGEACLRFC